MQTKFSNFFSAAGANWQFYIRSKLNCHFATREQRKLSWREGITCLTKMTKDYLDSASYSVGEKIKNLSPNIAIDPSCYAK